MSHASPLIATDIDAYLEEHQRKDLLRVFTCGSVDDGKSTLIGRLLHDSHLLYDDQLASLRSSPSARVNLILRCSPAGYVPSGNKASRSMAPTGISPRRNASSSSPILQAMSSTHETWPQEPPRLTRL